MSEEYRIAMIRLALLDAEIECMGMVAANKQREHHGESMRYDEQAFWDVLNRLNAKIESLRL